MSSFLLAGGYFVTRIGERINHTSRVLYITGGFSLLLLLLSIFVDGSTTTAEEFHNAVLLAGSDILGFVSGIGLTILVFGLTIWQFERKRPTPSNGYRLRPRNNSSEPQILFNKTLEVAKMNKRIRTQET